MTVYTSNRNHCLLPDPLSIRIRICLHLSSFCSNRIPSKPFRTHVAKRGVTCGTPEGSDEAWSCTCVVDDAILWNFGFRLQLRKGEWQKKGVLILRVHKCASSGTVARDNRSQHQGIKQSAAMVNRVSSRFNSSHENGAWCGQVRQSLRDGCRRRRKACRSLGFLGFRARSQVDRGAVHDRSVLARR